MKKSVAGLATFVLAAVTLTAPGSANAEPPGDDGADSPPPMRQLGERSAVAVDALRAVEQYRDAVKSGQDQRFSVTNVLVDPDGTTHTRMVRRYHGLPVLGGDVVVHQGKAGQWKGSSQTLDRTLALQIKPSVAAPRAGQKALERIEARAPRNAIEDADLEGKPRLVVDTIAGAPRLAWEVVTGGVQADGTPSTLHTYVNAQTGKVLRTEEDVHTVEGEGHSLYAGTVELETTLSNGTYELTDPDRGDTYTGDAQNETDFFLCPVLCLWRAPADLFTDDDNVWGDGTNEDRQSAAVDAQYGTSTTWDYFEDEHGRTGIEGDGGGSYNRVHYGNNYVNAFWDPSCFCMTYGDGDGDVAGPLVSLDVAGHEMTHGVTNATAELVYNGESGGLNESTSDIFGTMVEFYADNAADEADYWIGEEIMLDQDALRFMDMPSRDGASVDCWSGDVGNLDVHYSSGVGNHFFYLLAEGSGTKTIGGREHSSETCDGSSISGIGNDAAGQIWYRALTVTSDTDYAGASEATLDAAADLYGEGSTEHDAVADAWSAVSVG